MDWIRENKTLATIAGIFLAGALAIGALLLMAHFAYSDSLEKLDSLASKVANQEKAAIYPSEQNVAALEQKVTAYEASVTKLGDVLLKLQVPAKDISDTDFQNKLKQQIADVRAKAQEAHCQLPKDFAFGFEAYTKALPPASAAKQLNDYFDSVNAFVVAAIENGVTSIDSLQRTELKAEKGEEVSQRATEPKPEPKSSSKSKSKSSKSKGGKPDKPAREIAKVVERRQLTVTMTTDQRPLQALTNILASPTKMPYFMVVRNLRIENEKQEGPLRSLTVPLSPEPQKTTDPSAEQKPVGAEGDAKAAPKVEVITAPKPQHPDAVAVMGGEKLKVLMEIDLIRFVEPAPESADASLNQ